ncbi:MAG: hypothetical protein KGJ84_12465 [Elusimicrobia bacterium]|nr:hypothetical protein [Elusimicrobiota bacterium]
MKLSLLLAVLAVCAAPSRAADKPLRLKGGPKAEDVLRKFVSNDPRLKAKIDDAAKREEAFLAENRDGDLRDAVTDGGGDRASLIGRLPGMQAPVPSTCSALKDCARPELALDVDSPAQLPDALRSLVRPWMLLQAARGSELDLKPAAGDGDAVLTATLKGVDAPEMVLNVSPRLLGGFKVWFDQPLVLASVFGRERDAVLKSPR